MTAGGTSLRRTSALAAAVVVVAWASVTAGSPPPRAADPRPNVIIVLTDDQSFRTLPSQPATMPFLQSQIADPAGHWRWFPNASISTPLCCPSRATILTGRYAHNTGVQGNTEGDRLDEASTLAVWLQDAGYRTALIGKYLNRYPFGRGTYVPPGWDTWVAKENLTGATTYYDYPFIDGGVPMQAGTAPASYATDLLAARAEAFIETAPTSQPFFLLFSPSAPHSPWTPAPRDVGALGRSEVPVPASVGVVGPLQPPWLQALPPLDAEQLAALADARLHERETLLAVDDAMRGIIEAVAARGDLGRTVIVFLTDNGYSYGEHRWIGKSCGYAECVRTPFAISVPGGPSMSDPTVVSNVDLAPTIAGLAGVSPPRPVDGLDLAPLLLGAGPAPSREGVLTEYRGDSAVPAWAGIRTRDFSYLRTGDIEELYDLTGALGHADPGELDNRAADAAYEAVRSRLSALLDALRLQEPGAG